MQRRDGSWKRPRITGVASLSLVFCSVNKPKKHLAVEERTSLHRVSFLCVSLVRETKKKHVLCTNFVLSLSIEDDRRAMELSNGSMNFWFVSFCLFPVFFSDFLFFYFPAMNPVRISSSSSAESSSSTAQETQSYGHGVKIVNDSNLFERMYVIVIFFVSNSLSLSLSSSLRHSNCGFKLSSFELDAFSSRTG